MAMQRRMSVQTADVFPNGAFLKGGVEPVFDFNAEQRPDGSRPQQTDKDTGELVWQVQVLDADPDAGKKDTAVSVKLIGPVRPVPPANETPFPFTPVEFVNLTALAWIDDSGPRPRIAWSLRATDLKAPDSKPVRRAAESSSATAA